MPLCIGIQDLCLSLVLWFLQGSAFLKYLSISQCRQTDKSRYSLTKCLISFPNQMSFYCSSENEFTQSYFLQLQRGIREFFFSKDSSGPDSESQTLKVGRKCRCLCHSVVSQRWSKPFYFYTDNSNCSGS